MRRRSPRRRVASATLALWFALFSAAPSSWRPCPEHGLAGEAGHGAAQQMDGECAHHPSAPSAPTHAPSHPCDCPPSCGMAAVAARPDAPVTPLAGAEWNVPTERPPYLERTAPQRPRLLPFANGPPSFGTL